ncbi:transcriptional regulator TbsP domain-containing protein [Halobaculum litoreum]|uniref:DUF5821 family protein n=1 Tax=Halobaculum litoreum TaxID=3031998 RepID=A0ABD5XPZ7_9EURY|nr:DUF5821 family protein [Halobaculum sp. DT92]
MTTRSPSELVRESIAGAERALLVGPGPATVRALVAELRDRRTGDAPPPQSVRLLCTPETVDAALDDFLVAADAADAMEAGRLAVRTAAVESSLAIVDGRAMAQFSLPAAGPAPATVLGASGGGAVDGPLAAAYEDRWDGADEVSVDTPGRETVLDTFADRWPDAAPDLAALFDAVGPGTGDEPLDHVTACTLVAARNRLLAMRLGDWAESVGVSSRTEVARAKARLVDAGVVDTVREPVGVGRPRHRLVPADDRLADADPSELHAAVGVDLRG